MTGTRTATAIDVLQREVPALMYSRYRFLETCIPASWLAVLVLTRCGIGARMHLVNVETRNTNRDTVKDAGHVVVILDDATGLDLSLGQYARFGLDLPATWTFPARQLLEPPWVRTEYLDQGKVVYLCGPEQRLAEFLASRGDLTPEEVSWMMPRPDDIDRLTTMIDREVDR